MDFLNLAKDRYSVRKLSDKPVEPEKIEAILQAGLAAPTACNNQPYKIWVIRSPAAVEKMAEFTPFTFGAKVILAVGSKAEEGWVRKYDQKNFADVDAAIVATHLMMAIHDLGLGSTWIGHFKAPELKAAFPEMQDYEMIALFPIGYPAEDAEPAKGHFNCRERAELIAEL
ncbi:MAG: nitroreductase family protein [Clostridia bacterium]|nr:nitroreductase family protein [Clostridia bacterium]